MNKQQIIDKQLSDFQNGSDGRDEYPELFNLFKKHTLRIDIDHPVGEDVKLMVSLMGMLVIGLNV